jgi:hypothetical protein
MANPAYLNKDHPQHKDLVEQVTFLFKLAHPEEKDNS